MPFSNNSSTSNIQNSSLATIIDSYARYYASGPSHTARAKRLDLKSFLTFLKEYRGLSSDKKLKVRDWDFSAVQRFVDESLGKGEAPATVARRLATIKHMGRTLAEKVAGFINPAKEVKSPRIKAPRPKALSGTETVRVRKIAVRRHSDKDSFIRLRNQMLFNFLLDTGLRADEVRLLKLSQMDEKLEWIKNVRTKGRRYRNVYITSAIREQLSKYLEAREQELKRFFTKLSKAQDRLMPLFISTYAVDPTTPESFRMGAKTIWRAIHELSADIPLHPHLLRHSFAVDLLDASNDVRLVAQALGHSDVRTTMRYTERVEEELARVLEKQRKESKIKASAA